MWTLALGQSREPHPQRLPQQSELGGELQRAEGWPKHKHRHRQQTQNHSQQTHSLSRSQIELAQTQVLCH